MWPGDQNSETRIVQRLSEKESDWVANWGEEHGAFGLAWRPLEQYLLRYADGTLVAKAGILEHRVHLGQGDISIGGVGSVITMPEVRGQGHATALLRSVGDYLQDQRKVQFGMLFCREALIPFYSRLGWRLLEERPILQQANGPIPCPFPTMYLSCTGKPWPEGTAVLNSEPW